MRQNFLQHKKQRISHSLTAVLYILMVYFLFVQVQLIPGALAVLGLTFVLHFWVIDVQKYILSVSRRLRIAWTIISGLILALITSYNPTLILLSYIILHMGLFTLISSKRNFLINNVVPLPWLYCNKGMYIFTVFVTISYGILMVGIVQQIPFDCESIAGSYDAVGSTITRPRDRASQSVQSRWDTNIGKTSTNGHGTLNQRLQEFENLQLRDGIMRQSEEINKNICLTIFENLQNQLQKPGFQAAILVPLFLILSPIVRILFFVVSGLALVIVQFFITTGIYRKRTVTREVEEWY